MYQLNHTPTGNSSSVSSSPLGILFLHIFFSCETKNNYSKRLIQTYNNSKINGSVQMKGFQRCPREEGQDFAVKIKTSI